MRIVKGLKFWKIKNDFPKMLCEDIKKMHTTKETLTPVDKASIMYRLNKNDIKTFWECHHSNWWKANKNISTKIHQEGIKSTKRADSFDKIEMNGTDGSVVTSKD